MLLSEQLKIDSKLVELERAHRIGQYATGRTRTVVVKLLRYKDKEEILKRSKILKGTRYYIKEDFSESVRLKRKELVPQLQEARRMGKIAFLKFDQLVVRPPRCQTGESV